MKKIVIFLICSVVLLSCKNNTTENDPNAEKPKLSDGAYAQSAGRTNTLTIVMDNTLWEGEVGNVLRQHFAAPVPGLPQEEPMFTIKQMSPTAFSGFARKSRCFLRVKKGNKNYEILKNKYARPQIGVEISGQ